MFQPGTNFTTTGHHLDSGSKSPLGVCDSMFDSPLLKITAFIKPSVGPLKCTAGANILSKPDLLEVHRAAFQ